MMLRRCLPVFLLTVLFCAPALGQDTADSGAWRSIIQGVQESIERQQARLERFHAEMDALQEDLNEGLATAGDRLNQVLLLRTVAGETPWAYRTIWSQLKALQDYLELQKRPLEQRKRTLMQSKQDYESLRDIEVMSRQRDPESPVAAALSEPVDQLHRLKRRVSAAKREINEALAPADTLGRQVRMRLKAAKAAYYGSLKTYYFTPSADLWTFEGIEALHGQTSDWLTNAPRFWRPLLEWVEWGEFLGYTVLFWAALFVAGWMALRGWAEFRAPGWSPHPLKYGLLLLALSLALIGALCLTCSARNQLVVLAVPVLGSLGVLRLRHGLLHPPTAPAPASGGSGPDSESGAASEAEGEAASAQGVESSEGAVSSGGDASSGPGAEESSPAGAGGASARPPTPEPPPAPPSSSPLLPLWLLMAAGALLQILNVPSMLLQIVWPVCLVLGLWRIRRRLPGVREAVERFLLRASFVLLAAFTAMAVADMAALALNLTQAWFMLALTIQVLRTARRGLLRLAERLERGDGAHPGARALRELVFPLAVVLVLYLYSAWALHFMGGPGFARHVLRLDWTLGPAHLTFRGLSLIVISFFAVRLLLFLVHSGLEAAGARGGRMDQAKAHTVSTVSSYVIWVLFLLLVLYILGVSMGALTWIASGLSVGVGFGLKDIVNNFISGIIVLFGGTIKKGDIIQTDPKTMGEVVDVSVRNTIVRTLDNKTVIVPNQKFLSGEITNWSYGDRKLRLTIPISVMPGTKLKKMEKVLIKAAKQHPDVLEDPPPQVVSIGFGQLGLDFQLHAWIEDFHKKFQVETDLLSAIDQGFQAKKIIPAFRTVKKKYKLKGDEQAQLEAQREALREKRKQTYKLLRAGGRRHVRRRQGLTDSPLPRERGGE